MRLHPDKTRIVYCKDGRTAYGLLRAHGVHLPRVHVPRQEEPESAREPLPGVRPGHQQGRAEEDQPGSAGMAPELDADLGEHEQDQDDVAETAWSPLDAAPETWRCLS